jgi:signal transduction histidine kinase
MERALAWARRPGAARVLDAVLVVVLFGLGLAGHHAATTNPDVEAGPLSVAAGVSAGLAAGAVWWRRQRPLATLAALFVVAVVAAEAVPPGLYSLQTGLELMVICFAIGAWSTRPRTVLAVSVLLLAALVAGALDDGSNLLQATTLALALAGFPLVAGYAARARRQYVEEVERRLVQAERDRDARARRAIEEERTRIARELHDVVAHHVSLIGVQAGAARRALGRDAAAGGDASATEAALLAIESSSREAVGEMRQLLQVLRPADGDAGREAPQPGLHALPTLAERWRAAGVAVDCRTRGLDTAPPLPSTLSLSCYRVVEESLTNVARHSAARSARVAVDVGADAVHITVHDPGPAEPAAPAAAGGRGLVGMAERVALFGGSLTSGTTDDGGFVVEAVVPRPPA